MGECILSVRILIIWEGACYSTLLWLHDAGWLRKKRTLTGSGQLYFSNITDSKKKRNHQCKLNQYLTSIQHKIMHILYSNERSGILNYSLYHHQSIIFLQLIAFSYLERNPQFVLWISRKLFLDQLNTWINRKLVSREVRKLLFSAVKK